jgi:rubrerythrin
MATSEDNLKEAFAGESQANRKYLAFAERAERDGFPNIAKLFRTTAEAETIHAMGHLKAMGGVGSTVENLQGAIDGETHEYTEMYPPMLEQAESDGHKAERMFKLALAVEETHAKLYKAALEAAAAGKDLDTDEIYICPVCGHIEFGKPSDACPVCRAKADKFMQV